MTERREAIGWHVLEFPRQETIPLFRRPKENPCDAVQGDELQMLALYPNRGIPASLAIAQLKSYRERIPRRLLDRLRPVVRHLV